jgi:pimeloyl-ACP methyl ester carboxylesterase
MATVENTEAPSKPMLKQRKRHRRWPWVLLVIFLVIVFAAWCGLGIYADMYISTNGRDTNALGMDPYAHAKSVTYSTGLGAWYAAPAKGDATVIIVHGYGANRTDHFQVGERLQALGYGILAIDLGNESSTEKYGGGIPEAKNVDLAAQWALRNGSTKIVLLGYSAGGTASVLAASMDPSIAGVVADSSPVSFIELASERVGMPTWIFDPASWFYGLIVKNGQLGSLNSLPSTYSSPTLVIQGGSDLTVNPSNGPSVAKLTHGSLWAVAGVGHTDTFYKCPSNYVDQLNTFFQDAVTHHAFMLNAAC